MIHSTGVYSFLGTQSWWKQGKLSQWVSHEDSYPLYDNGLVFEHNRARFTNQYVVPYYPQLLLLFDCHINVKISAGLGTVKYLSKYIYKGPDGATMEISGGVQDEIKAHLDGWFIGPTEALSQTSFSHISINSSIILTVSTAMESPQKDLLINASHVLRWSILAEISGRSTDNYYGTIYQIIDISETAMINASVLGSSEALFIPLRISLEQPQGD